MSVHYEQVAAALDAVAIEGFRYRWLGRVSRPLPARLRHGLDGEAQRQHLRRGLREELYGSFYCRGRVTRAPLAGDQPVSADPRLVAALAAASASRSVWESGWTVEQLSGDHAVVASPRLRVRVATAACRPANGAVVVGESVSLPAPSVRPGLSPGFFTVIGDAGDESAGPVVRSYWNVAPAGGVALVAALTSRLNAAGARFRLKVLDHPLRFGRCDAAVLYVGATDFAGLRSALVRIASQLEHVMHPAVPAFTQRLAPGLGVSECDGSGESFGLRRCTLLADAILAAHDMGVTPRAARLRTVAAHFAVEGVDIDAPYLEPSLAGRHVL